MTTDISISTHSRLSVRDVTDEVEKAIPTNANGTATVFVQHTTAGVTVNEGEEKLRSDIERALSELVADESWRHDRIDDNADAHLRAMLIGPSVTVPISGGSLDMGTWQSILFVECDGPRTRTIRIITK